MRDPPAYDARVKDYVARFATAEKVPDDGKDEDDDDEDEDGDGDGGSSEGGSEMSDMGSLGEDEDELKMDDL